MKVCVLGIALLLASLTPFPVAAQWLHQWDVSPHKAQLGSEQIPQERIDWVADEFAESGKWMEGLGFPAPHMRPVRNGTKYYAQINYDFADEGYIDAAGAAYKPELGYIVIRPNLFTWTDGTQMEPADLRDGFISYQEGFMLSGVHELFHAVQQSYEPIMPTLGPLMWIWEGTADAVRHAWAEHTYGNAYVLPRHYDDPLNEPRSTPTSHQNAYDTSHFWYHIGGDIGSEGRIAYLQGVFEELARDTDVAHYGLAPVVAALEGYDGGLYNLYPQFIARHANEDKAFRDVKPVHLGPGDRIVDDEAMYAVLKPFASNAYRVHLDVPQGETLGLEVRVRGEPDSLRDLHLIIGTDRYDLQGTGEERNLYRTALTSDTAPDTLFIRVANVAEDELASRPRGYTLELSMQPVDPCAPVMMDAGTNDGGFMLAVTSGAWATMGAALGPQTGAGSLRFDGLVSDTGEACTLPISALPPIRTASGPESDEDKARREENMQQLQQQMLEFARKMEELNTRIAQEVFGKDSMEDVTDEDYANMSPEQQARQMEMMGFTPDAMAEMRRELSNLWLQREGDVVITVFSPNATPWITGMLAYPMGTRHGGIGGWRPNAAGLIKLQLPGTSAADLKEGQAYAAQAYAPVSAERTPGKAETRNAFYMRWDATWVDDCGEIPESMRQSIESSARQLDPSGTLIDAKETSTPGCIVDGTSQVILGDLTGTVTIDEITGAEVKGTFSVTGPATVDISGEGGESQRSGPLIIEGSFSAPTERRPVETSP